MSSPQSNLSARFPNLNCAWASLLLESLAKKGVHTAVVSPGSRSGPLAWAAAQLAAKSDSFEAIPVLDERSAAFFALGLARRTLCPTVLICTSGTAGANYFPAVIEARESGIPLIILTADRPPEMRHCHSGQTIDQVNLFGNYPVWQTEVALPSAEPHLLRYLRQTAAFAVHRSLEPFCGPCHLNLPFRDPLAPVQVGDGITFDFQPFQDYFSTSVTPSLSLSAFIESLPPLRGIITVGGIVTDNPSKLATVLESVAASTGWPILADALSSLRGFATNPTLWCAHYDTILRNESAARDLAPEFVLQVGQLPTSKTLRQWLERLQPQTLALGHIGENLDPLHNRTSHSAVSIAALAHTNPFAVSQPKPNPWATWDHAASSALTAGLANADFFFEGKVVASLARTLPKNTALVIANSMPVRDAEYFIPISNNHHVIYSNRGANGIDGTLSTALGIAHGGSSTFLLTGDLAFLHDSGALLLGPKFKGSLTIIVINNAGGGIFEHLPIAQYNPPFEEFFATPQKIDLASLAAAHGITHTLISSERDLTSLLKKPSPSGIRLVEIPTDRKRDASFRKQLFASVDQSLNSLSSNE